MENHKSKEYSGIFLACTAGDGTIYTPMAADHTLGYIYAGEMEIVHNGETRLLHKGDCFFFRRDHRISTTKYAYEGEDFRGTFLTFPRKFLRDHFAALDKKDIPEKARRNDEPVMLIPPRPDLTSLFESLLPYYEMDTAPTEDVVRLKLQEGVNALLRTDESLFPVLFDFSEPWKIDLMQFLEENYMYDLSLEQIASYTGRSLATFKRDFAKVSDLPPQKWLIRRRLQAAYDKMRHEGKKVSEVYDEVGFKNLAHFYAAFKRQYGYSPAK